MIGDHNMNQKITGTLFSAGQVDAIEKEWRDKCQRYIELHDAVVKDNDRAYGYIQEALAQPEERNFCSRCGKRTADLTTIHTCTPPMENT